MNKNKIEIEFEVESVIYQDKDTRHVRAAVKITEYPNGVDIPTSEPIIEGYIRKNLKKRDSFKATGEWKDRGVHGYQFVIEQAILTVPETHLGLIDFLHRNLKGVGKQTATRIVETFGLNVIGVIRDTPEELLKVKGITKKRANEIHVELEMNAPNYEKFLTDMICLGFEALEPSHIFTELGSMAMTSIEEDPYLVRRLKIADFKRCDKVAQKFGISSVDNRRIKQLITEYISHNLEDKGNLYVHKEIMISEMNKFASDNGSYSKSEIITELHIEEALKELLKSNNRNRLVIELDKDNKECIYSEFYRGMENQIVKMIKKMLKQNNRRLEAIDVTNFLSSKEKKDGFKLAKGQQDAVAMAVMNKISILSGGPGTGKTTTINAITGLINKCLPEATIALAAFTGKAAKRMTETTGMEACTIHRLIGLNTSDEDEEQMDLKEVDVEFLIIDEASMIDTFLFYSLLKCVPEKTNILIAGDYEQLPSVGPGLVLRDLIHSGVIETTILTEIFRQAQDSQIIQNAYKVLEGNSNLSLDNSKRDFYLLDNRDKKKIEGRLLNSIDRLLSTGFKIEDIQVLSSMNRGDLGVAELNKKMQKRFNKRKGCEEVRVRDRMFRLGDKVIQTRNNYELEVFNGETGVIIALEDTKVREVTVDFGEKVITYIAETVSELDLAYVITIHKSQGSEYKVVLIPIHDSLEYTLNRNTVYTAITRSSERLILIGDERVFKGVINKTDNIQRNSQIKDKLMRA